MTQPGKKTAHRRLTAGDVLFVRFLLSVLPVVAGCNSPWDIPDPVVEAIDPPSHEVGTAVTVQVKGRGFLPKVTRQLSNDHVFSTTEQFEVKFHLQAVDQSKTVPLTNVTYLDGATLLGTVPKNISPGEYAAEIITPLGKSSAPAGRFVAETPMIHAGDSESNSETDSERDTDTETDSFSDADTDTDTDSDTDTDTDADTDTDTDSDTDTDTDTDTDGDSETGSEVDTESNQQSTDTDMDTDTFEESDGTDVAEWTDALITVDGQLIEESWNPETPIRCVITGELDDSAFFDVQWNLQYLYIGIAIYDDTLLNDSAIKWEDDSVDIVIDGNHDRSGPMDASDDHCIKAYADPTLYCQSNNTAAILHAWASMAGGGYSIELAFPWTHFGLVPWTGMVIGFDVGINDDDGDNWDLSRDNQYRWTIATDDWWNTSLYGEITLVNDDVSTVP